MKKMLLMIACLSLCVIGCPDDREIEINDTMAGTDTGTTDTGTTDTGTTDAGDAYAGDADAGDVDVGGAGADTVEECTPEFCMFPPVEPDLCADGVTRERFECRPNPEGVCEVYIECPDAERCTPGEWIESRDGCNSCACPESGLVSEAGSCTELACPEICRTIEDCPDSMTCHFEDGACGALSDGICITPPEICPAGGVGIIGCQGGLANNTCELWGSGGDGFAFGGAGNPESDVFSCGDLLCDMATELCLIRMNGANADTPFFASCQALQSECPQGDCSCLDIPQGPGAPECLDSPGQTYLFYSEE